MLSGNCTAALSIQANVTISGSRANLIKNGIAPLPFPLPALLQPYWHIKRGERVRVRGHAQFYAMLRFTYPGNGQFGSKMGLLSAAFLIANLNPWQIRCSHVGYSPTTKQHATLPQTLLRRVRHLRPSQRGRADLLRPVRAPASRAGKRRYRHLRRLAIPGVQGHGLGFPDF